MSCLFLPVHGRRQEAAEERGDPPDPVQAPVVAHHGRAEASGYGNCIAGNVGMTRVMGIGAGSFCMDVPGLIPHPVNGISTTCTRKMVRPTWVRTCVRDVVRCAATTHDSLGHSHGLASSGSSVRRWGQRCRRSVSVAASTAMTRKMVPAITSGGTYSTRLDSVLPQTGPFPSPLLTEHLDPEGRARGDARDHEVGAAVHIVEHLDGHAPRQSRARDAAQELEDCWCV